MHSSFVQDVHHLELLALCKESREVYLKTFKHHLPGRRNQMIRFSDDTTIYIAKFRELTLKARDYHTEHSRWPTMECWDTIRELGLDEDSYDSRIYHQLISRMEKLKKVTVYMDDMTSLRDLLFPPGLNLPEKGNC